MFEICVFVIHVWWTSLPFVMDMLPLDNIDDGIVPIHFTDDIEMDIVSLNYTSIFVMIMLFFLIVYMFWIGIQFTKPYREN